MYFWVTKYLKMKENPFKPNVIGGLGYILFYIIEIFSICSITNTMKKYVNISVTLTYNKLKFVLNLRHEKRQPYCNFMVQ